MGKKRKAMPKSFANRSPAFMTDYQDGVPLAGIGASSAEIDEARRVLRLPWPRRIEEVG